jgi:hypothetical protein
MFDVRNITIAVKMPLIILFFLSISQKVLAYLEEDIRRLLDTNACEQCDLREANLRKAKLKNANLFGADLTGADLTAADLGHAKIDESNFSGADLSYSNLSGANLSKAILSGSNLSGANLDGANLSSAYLYKAKLVGADLSNANLDSARLSEVDLTEARLVGARIDLMANHREGSEAKTSEISIQLVGGYRGITSFDLTGDSKYMTSKSGRLYKSKERVSTTRYGDYVRKYPDLVAAYAKYKNRTRTKLLSVLSKNLSIDEWGKLHWEQYGHEEDRRLGAHLFPNFEVVLDLKTNPKFTSEQEVGLLSVVTRDDLIYLSYTIQEGDDTRESVYLVVEEYSETLERIRTIFKVKTASFAHVAGTLVFDQFGNLYLSVGEGRISDYESQKLDSFLGKILRFDISKKEPTPEIVAYGLRNPWKISIDSNDRMFVGDCGDATTESVYLLDNLNPRAPYNLGWPVFEGTERITDHVLRFEDTLAPIFEYKHQNGIGICVIGGFFLDNPDIYVFGDYLGKIRFLREGEVGNWYEIHSQDVRGVLSLGIDPNQNRIFMSSWDKIYELEISSKQTKFFPSVIFCRTVMPNKAINNTGCD